MSTEPIVSPPRSSTAQPACAGCGAPVAADQRYCLECGERRPAMSSVLLGEAPLRPRDEAPPATPPLSSAPPAHSALTQRGDAPLTLIAAVGVLMIAMGVGVLIGRSAGSRPAAPAQVISVASTPSAGPAAAAAASESPFTDDWPSGTSGYTVQLQTLAQSSSASQVQAAKAASAAKGATGVGALRSSDFSSLKPGHYVIYSGVYHKQAEAQRALAGLKKRYPSAVVIAVSNKASSGSSGASSQGSGSSGVGQSLSHPAPPSSLQGLGKVKGKSYEERSKSLPNVVSTG